MNLILRAGWIVVLVACTLSSPLLAHGLGAGQGELAQRGQGIHLILTPSSAAFLAFDENQDGLLQADEIRIHREALLKKIRLGLDVKDQSGQAGHVVFEDILMGVDHHSGEAGHFLKIRLTYIWDALPDGLQLRYEVGEGAPITLRYHQSTASGNMRLEVVTLKSGPMLHRIVLRYAAGAKSPSMQK